MIYVDKLDVHALFLKKGISDWIILGRHRPRTRSPDELVPWELRLQLARAF